MRAPGAASSGFRHHGQNKKRQPIQPADETVPANDAVLIREHCRQNRPALLWVDGGGHDAVEQVEQHAARLVDFLRGAGLVFAP